MSDSISSESDLKDLKAFLKDTQINQNEEDLRIYGRDWLPHFEAKPSLLLFPENTEQVQEIVLWARKKRKKLVPSGGRTGLSGAATASKNEVVVSFDHMNQILNFDSFEGNITCQPGVVTEHVQNYVKERGFLFPVHFSAQGSSQIGGNIATNAGGIKVIRFGSIRQWVMSLKVVTGKGDVLELGRPLMKDASGYDLKQLFIGSEGTLGFVVEVTLRCTSKPQNTQLLFLGFEKLSSLLFIFQAMKQQFTLHSFEFMTDVAIQKVISSSALSLPLSTSFPFYLLIEVESHFHNQEEELLSVYEKMDEKAWVQEACISQSSQQEKNLWALRENISESLSPFSPYKNDISVPISKIPTFIEDLEKIIQEHYSQFQVVWFGHIGDGNLHINILKPDSWDLNRFSEHCKKIDPLIFKLVQKSGGSVSAEHGIGLLKKPFLSFSRSSSEIKIMKEIKKIFDPDGIMNPGKIW